MYTTYAIQYFLKYYSSLQRMQSRYVKREKNVTVKIILRYYKTIRIIFKFQQYINLYITIKKSLICVSQYFQLNNM